ncbi:hypothetical protein Pint_19222 [Pistacia integerrima]|uniref:Uncharacterized protein n=1 Tax=Pistacia integerrima TaxID=434235 RepID=A0ACC0YXD8_9ROSI|nr:hypothetical protein Pint_19222 [Pistacia integerrima]
MVMESADDSVHERTGKRPRLFIKEMVMRNFKSYAGEQRVGPFHKSFSAVVGPNGSGKSNVIDAMLFVFGKRAKQMRLNKVSELIHNSTNHQNLDNAGVSVHFQEIVDLDDGTYEAVPGSDFVITRVAFRDNSSKYYINDRQSNFTEVTKKLKGKGVDLDNNRFLILQGEVEQISLMKPKAQGPHDEGFLEYLEDIIGTNKYVEKIDESYKELESLNEKRSGVVQMVKLAEKERDSLEVCMNVKNEAEAYMLKELSLLKWQEKATQLASEDTSQKMVDLQEKVSNLEENLKNERKKIQDNNKTLKELESVHNKYMKRQEASISFNLLNLTMILEFVRKSFKEFERQDVKYREDLKHMKQKIKKLEDKLEKDSSKIDDLTKDCENSTNLIPKLEDSIPNLQKLLVEEEKILEEIKDNAKVEAEKYRSELTTHEAGRVAFEDAQKQMDDILERINTKNATIANMQSDLEKNKLEALEARKVEQDCIKEQEAIIPLEQAARQKLAELKSVMDSEKSQGSVLKAILQAKESNQIQGIHGRMGDLGAIDAKYDIAISTACPGLDYIVVETTDAAQACVELLRREKLGVATFMILEKQVDLLPKLKEKVSTPEGVPRLFDLIKVRDERMKLAFYAALGNTIVVKDLDQATRIAYGGNKEFRRVVTLDGALFEKIWYYEWWGNIRHRISEAMRHYQASEKEVALLEMEFAKSQKEIDSLKTQHGYLEKQLGSLEAASKPRKDETDRLKELKNIISAEEKEIDKLMQGSKKLKEKALELQSKIENAGGEKLKAQKAKVDKIQDIDKNSTEINRHKVLIETGQKKMIKKLTKGIEDAGKEKERLIKEKEKMREIFKEIEQKAFTVQENYKNTQKLIDQHKDVLDNAKSDYEKVKKIVDELRASEVQLMPDYKLQDMKKSYKELEMKGKGYNKRLNDLQMALVKHLEQYVALEMVALLEAQLKELNPNLDSISEYRRKVSLYDERVEDLTTVTQQRDDIKKLLDEFMAGFSAISLKLKEMYQFLPPVCPFPPINVCILVHVMNLLQMITLGGDAELELVDSLDPFSEGVVFSVRPPKKSWKNIANLSGGEKTLSSLALVFALHHYKPTPLYVMDEIDAALDFKNVSIVGHYVKDRTKDAQFIIISLRNNMFELADRLVGIYKTDNCTKSITINPKSFTVCEKSAA